MADCSDQRRASHADTAKPEPRSKTRRTASPPSHELALRCWPWRAALAGTIPAALKANLDNGTFSGNQLSDCGVKDTSASDCSALLSLGAAWSLWAGLTGTSYCSWAGVACDIYGRVASLALSGKGLSGPIAPTIGSLSALSALDLSNNAFSGTIPVAVKALTGITEASTNLRGNQLSDCGVHDASAADCAALLSLSATLHLWLSLSGTSYCSWAGISCSAAGRVTGLALSGAGLAGLLSDAGAALGSLAALQALDLSHNGFSGTIPAALGSLASLTSLALDHNQLTGVRAGLRWLPRVLNPEP